MPYRVVASLNRRIGFLILTVALSLLALAALAAIPSDSNPAGEVVVVLDLAGLTQSDASAARLNELLAAPPPPGPGSR
ncbi:MAG: hypothetical protein ABJB47_10450 [Actinomycetota bacterium]